MKFEVTRGGDSGYIALDDIQLHNCDPCKSSVSSSYQITAKTRCVGAFQVHCNLVISSVAVKAVVVVSRQHILHSAFQGSIHARV